MCISNILILVMIDHDPILVLRTLEKIKYKSPPPIFFLNLWQKGVVWGQAQHLNQIIFINNTLTKCVVLLN